MSNGNQNIIQVIFNKIFGSGKSSALTSKKNEIILKLVKMHILEMEDVLFHLNSAVMMPENPQGKSSAHGGGASDEQIVLTGKMVNGSFQASKILMKCPSKYTQDKIEVTEVKSIANI